MNDTPLKEKERKLIRSIERLGSVVVAYSGGVDSSVVAHYARKTLKDRALVVIAVSPSLAARDLDDARAQAQKCGWDLIEIRTNEIEREEYRKNNGSRCYHCKSALFEALDELARSLSIKHIAYGANVDDMSDFRPGHRAAEEHNVVSPLREAQLSKDEIRELARAALLPSWDRPQSPCLASRIPAFTEVTIESLAMVEAAESALVRLGMSELRVRHHGDLARLELTAASLSWLFAEASRIESVTAAVKACGYKFVAVDLEGYRRGSSNAGGPDGAPLFTPEGNPRLGAYPY